MPISHHGYNILTLSESIETQHADSRVPCLSDVLAKQLGPTPEIPTATTDLGRLSTLPPELLYLIFDWLDIQSLRGLSRTSRAAYHHIHFFPSFRRLLTICPLLIHSLLATQTAVLYRPAELLRHLSDPDCAYCPETPAFAGYFYILGGARVCLRCLAEDEMVYPTSVLAASREFALTRKQLADLPTLSTVPGRYGSRPRKLYRRRFLDWTAARSTGERVHGSVEGLEAAAGKAGGERERRYMERALQYAIRTVGGQGIFTAGGRPRPPPGQDIERDRNWCDQGRFAGAVRVPCVEWQGRKVEWGVYCKGCQDVPDEHEYADTTLYDEVRLKEHFEKSGLVCAPAAFVCCPISPEHFLEAGRTRTDRNCMMREMEGWDDWEKVAEVRKETEDKLREEEKQKEERRKEWEELGRKFKEEEDRRLAEARREASSGSSGESTDTQALASWW